MTRFEKAKELFLENKGILRTSQAKKLGIDYRTLSRMLEAGLLVRESRGIYRLADLPPLGNPDLVTVCLHAPSSVICLISALHFHSLTTQIPYRVFIALPQDTRPPRIKYPLLDIVWLSEKPYQAGIEDHSLDGVSVHIYSKEKTVADCFKFRNKIGKKVALEALKDYLREPEPSVESLLHYARIDRVEKVIRPYIEALM